MRNAGLDESLSGINIAGRKINNLRYADDTTLKAESKEELKSPLMKVKEESKKVDLKLNLKKLRSWLQPHEVKWALESITTNKASGGDQFQLSSFKS